MSKIYFGGSRNLQSSPILGQVVSAVLASGSLVRVGCSAGADALVISCVLKWRTVQQGSQIAIIPIRSRSFSQVHVFSAFAQSSAGSWSGSAVQIVYQFAQAGGQVSWLAGGSLAVPLAGRLIQRSIAGLHGCSSAVFFSPGAGSLAVASHAVKASIPVFAFSPSVPASPVGCSGSWVASSFMGFACWSWQSAQLSLF